MIFFSFQEICVIVLVAIFLDWWIGDPRFITHPVVWIGRMTRQFENRWLYRENDSPKLKTFKGIILTAFIVSFSFGFLFAGHLVTMMIHPWINYLFHVWFVATTIACTGLRDAAILVYRPLHVNDLLQARESVSQIVGRDTAHLDDQEVVRATVETVAENTVDGFVAPLCFALLGAAPLAMSYRAANTLDSMVGYRNARYKHFGWCSARLDDILNWIPARLTGWMFVWIAWIRFGGARAKKTVLSIRLFACLHPSPNSGIPESAVAGALRIRLGGTNRYGETISHRAHMGWPEETLAKHHILLAVRMLIDTRRILLGGLILCILFGQLYSF
jgi:adenosylcobinamide-phosphate synthase